MGRKRSGGRKQIYLCVAILIFLSPMACALSKMMSTKTVDTTGEEARTHLFLGRTYLAQEDFGSALRESEKVMSLAGNNVPVDDALFYIGLIYAHPANPERDYVKSIVSFRRLMKDYPGSPLVEQAKILVGLLQENDKLNRTVERLNNIIDELKKVDIGVEEKKREKTK